MYLYSYRSPAVDVRIVAPHRIYIYYWPASTSCDQPRERITIKKMYCKTRAEIRPRLWGKRSYNIRNVKNARWPRPRDHYGTCTTRRWRRAVVRTLITRWTVKNTIHVNFLYLVDCFGFLFFHSLSRAYTIQLDRPPLHRMVKKERKKRKK